MNSHFCFYIIVLFLSSIIYKSVFSQLISNNNNTILSDDNFFSNSYLNIFSRKISKLSFPLAVTNNTNNECKKHIELYSRELEKFTLWASQMFDAGTKFPVGILIGSTFDFGNFDECVQISANVDGEHIRGQFCSAAITYELPISSVSASSNTTSNDDIWTYIKKLSPDRRNRLRNEIQWSICVPASCTFEDVQFHMQNVLDDITGNWTKANVLVEKDMCQVDNGFNFSKGDIIFICIFSFFAMIVLVCTSYELFTVIPSLKKCRFTESGKMHRVLESFSASSNIQKLQQYNKDPDKLNLVHGLKFLSLSLIIMGHRLMFVLGGAPIINTDYVEQGYAKLQAILLLNGPIIVDIFFTISGFLVCYLLLQEFSKRKSINYLLLYIHRYVRLTPVYAIVIAFYCTTFVKIGSGAVWMDKVGGEQKKCLESWWANLLYINNYVQVENLCMFQSWYITCDMHLFMIAPFIVQLLYKKSNIGKIVLYALIVISTIASFITIYSLKLDPILLLYMKTLKDPLKDATFLHMYIPTHTRATPYFIGMLAGYIRYSIKGSNYKFTKKTVNIGWTITLILLIFTFFSAIIFYQPDYTYNVNVSALYGSLHRVTWSIAISWVILATSTGNGRVIEGIFSWKPIITLSRLSYCAYLCHGAVQMYTVACARVPYYASMFHLAWTSIADITFSYLIAFVLTLLFESPILRLENVFLRSEKKPRGNNEKIDMKVVDEKFTYIETVS